MLSRREETAEYQLFLLCWLRQFALLLTAGKINGVYQFVGSFQWAVYFQESKEIFTCPVEAFLRNSFSSTGESLWPGGHFIHYSVNETATRKESDRNMRHERALETCLPVAILSSQRDRLSFISVTNGEIF
jgi:hypothetical protein